MTYDQKIRFLECELDKLNRMREPSFCLSAVLVAAIGIFYFVALLMLTGCVGTTGIRAAEVTGVDLDVGSDVILLAERSIIPVCVLIGLIVLGILGRNVSIVWRGHIETEKGQCIKNE
jgi:hypothetical protein